MRATVTTGARLHLGFQNLSLTRPRLYGGAGLAVERPRLAVAAEPADGVTADDSAVREYAARAVEVLDLPGAAVEVVEELPRHVGLGSGTQLALATLLAVARAHERSVDPRALAPDLGRGGRSGVGVATFERGGFVLDAGHPTGRFTTTRPRDGDWTVPPVAARHEVPDDWRLVVVRPDVEPGPSGDDEDASMRSVVEAADPAVADEIAVLVTHRLLPAVATGDVETFGDAVVELGRLNGAWYADEQGGVYRPPAGVLVEELASHPAVAGTDQSSWGPTVYGVTDAARADGAREAARAALAVADVDGEVTVTRARNEGATVEITG